MIRPPRLQPGSLIRLVAPASAAQPRYLESGLQLLRQLGFHPRHSPLVYQTRFYSAGADEDRYRELKEALLEPDAAPLWFVRGGYGSGRLLPYLERDFPSPPPQARPVLGCSDTTFLLLFMLQRWNWVVFHSPMPAGDLSRGKDAFDASYLFDLLQGRPVRTSVSPGPLTVIHGGPEVSAPLTGGCLSILAATLGTPWEWQTEGKLLFIEETAEKPFRLDRMLTQLRQAGKFDHCRGIVFGELPGCHPPAGAAYTLPEALRYALEGLDIPVLAGLSSGHCQNPSLALAPGARYRLDPATARLYLLEDPVCLS